jgi:hypothetical protein
VDQGGDQEYILRSWSLVKMGTTANQKKLFFNLRKAKSKISALEEGDLRPDQVKLIAKRLGVTEQDVVDMNRRWAATCRSTRRSARMAIPANGRTGWSTTFPTRKRVWRKAKSRTIAAKLLAMRSPCSTTASAASSRRADWRTTDHARGSGRRVRCLPRARASNRGARVREGAARGEKPHRSDGDPSGRPALQAH